MYEEKHFCLGLMFSPDLAWLVVVEKKRPVSLAGKLNGTGGELHPDELQKPIIGMRRECQEETSVVTLQWETLGRLYIYHGPNSVARDVIHLYACQEPNWGAAHTTGDESVMAVPTHIMDRLPVVADLPTLVAMAKQCLQAPDKWRETDLHRHKRVQS